MILSSWRSRFLFLSIVTASFLLTLLPPARAASVQVVCPGGGPGAYSSINAALSALDPHGPNTITVSGTCVENIFIPNFGQLVIQSAPGQTATLTAPDPSGFVLHTFQSTGILLSGLVFQGGSQSVVLSQGSNVTIVNCTIQQSSGEAGLHVQTASTLVVENSTIQDNQGRGLQVNGNSNVSLATSPNQRIRVLRNGGDGIQVDGSYLQVNFGTLDVENNAGAAIAQSGGRLLMFGDGVNGGSLFQGNGEGIDIFQAGSAHFFGRNVIRGNGDVGIQVWGSSALFTGGGILPDGSLSATIVQGHNTVGINVIRLGELTMSGPHQIQNNGSSAADPGVRGGIRVNRGSLALDSGVQVTNNTGVGIRAVQNTGVSLLANVTVSGNTEGGVLVDRQSVAGFFQPFSIVGNGIASISCDTTSLIFGDLTGVAGIDCMRIERTLGPPRPGRVLP